ncbi:hypothetical protein JEY40_25315 [Bradyrhizobium japonicum]|uniref:hypothetical protein n=1 Tax=Bradyrhizobium japonicum TaxID=375 RepID=UPI00200D2F95|nr:hypothetical protein [Bradyrhizobium japonicum]UQD69334.1 hypothetical protein JEY40_25315 [Bradyrhizobium japonicum]
MPMESRDAAEEIRRILRRELDDCERALNNDDVDKAKRELEDAISKLKRLANSLG